MGGGGCDGLQGGAFVQPWGGLPMRELAGAAAPPPF